MKRFIQLLLFFLFINSLYASVVNENDIYNAYSCVKDVVFVSCNYFISEKQPTNPSIVMRTPKNTNISDAIVFNNCDMSDIFNSFSEDKIDTSNLVDFLKEPLYPYVKQKLETSDWQIGQANVLGAIAIAFRDNSTLEEVLINLINDIYPRMGVVTDLTLSGEIFPNPLNVKGVFILEEVNKELEVVALQMMINDEEIDIYKLSQKS
ncbi:MAG: hypothetical protein ACPKM0_04800 [Pleomorphochaeta sp.]